MKLKVDRDADALYLTLTDQPVVRTEEVSPGLVVDYDTQGRIVGIEMLYLSTRAQDMDVRRLVFETV